MDISMDIMLAQLLIKLTTYMLYLSVSLSVVLNLHFLVYSCHEVESVTALCVM